MERQTTCYGRKVESRASFHFHGTLFNNIESGGMKLVFSVKSIHIGKPRQLQMKGKAIQSSIFKESVTSNVMVTSLGIEGDTQSDLVNHGGVDKAICAYPFEHYPYWERKIKKELEGSAFGENLTLEGLLEDKIHIGDVFTFGKAIIQVSQPRQPCFKLGLKHSEPKLTLWVQETGFTGFYFRVLKEGEVGQKDRLELIERNPSYPTVHETNLVKYDKNPKVESLKRMSDIPTLSESWKAEFRQRLLRSKK
ncbi:MOSC domain-containing protein [Bacillus solitudinis]|uniref:MOSC domain-containing protein n=1 Tax=Bacillus solitudinis TaxID=2014074 RepID=UPI000C235F6F|nr:MOSC domain-containing protein [Bacillus solitudinis]